MTGSRTPPCSSAPHAPSPPRRQTGHAWKQSANNSLGVGGLGVYRAARSKTAMPPNWPCSEKQSAINSLGFGGLAICRTTRSPPCRYAGLVWMWIGRAPSPLILWCRQPCFNSCVHAFDDKPPETEVSTPALGRQPSGGTATGKHAIAMAYQYAVPCIRTLRARTGRPAVRWCPQSGGRSGWSTAPPSSAGRTR